MKTLNLTGHIVSWLENHAKTAKKDGYIIGVSGGIDSAVVSSLCALTGLKTVLLTMPIHQEVSQTERATKHIDGLKINKNVYGLNVDLTSTYDEFIKNFDKNNFDKEIMENAMFLAHANSRSRLRMTTLYSYASMHNLLVCGTGNKIEDFGVGFFTKYGDGAIDLSPIGDLVKSEVYELGAFLGVDKEILIARPTDGLWEDGRTDEDQIGATYDELEWAMNLQETCGNTIPEGMNLDKRKMEVWNIYIKRHFANRHKMEMPPICLIPKDIKQ